jgi:hypothetical protein
MTASSYRTAQEGKMINKQEGTATLVNVKKYNAIQWMIALKNRREEKYANKK